MDLGAPTPTDTPDLIRLDVRRVATVLGVLVVGLSVASYVMHLLTRAADAGTIAALDVGDEVSLPTLFGTGLLAAAGLVLLVGRQRARVLGEPVRGWLSLALVMFALCVDEAVSVHERLGSALRDLTGATGFFYYVWVFPALAFVAVVAVVQLGWLRSLPPRTRGLVVLAGVVFVLGAAGLELLAGAGDEASGTDTLTSVTLTAVEELAEMTGISLFVVALLDHLSGFRLQVDFGRASVEADRQR